MAPIQSNTNKNPSSSSFLTETNHQTKLDFIPQRNKQKTEDRPSSPKNKDLLKGKPIIFVGGGPGSGKGTQCEKMIENYGFTHLSAGDLIRAASQDSSTEKGRYFNEAMSQGKLISTVIKTSTIS